MEKRIAISNTTGGYFELAYRMPGETSKILTITVNPYALNTEYSFPNEVYYNEFMRQNKHYFEGKTPVLIEGKTRGSKLEKINQDIEANEVEKINSEVKAFDNAIMDSANEVGVKLEVEVQKVRKGRARK